MTKKRMWIARGKRQKHSKGYVRVLCSDHPNANKDGRMYEHILIISNLLGRGLRRKEQVHHVDGNPQNNAIQNLKIVTPSEHRLIHSHGKGARSKRPHCAECMTLIPYKSKTGLCVKHYWISVRTRSVQCFVDGCSDISGARSGLCRRHLNFRNNKRRYSPKWNFTKS